MAMFLLEAGMLAVAGIVVGLALGTLGVLYLATVGYNIGSSAELASSAYIMSSTIYARFRLRAWRRCRLPRWSSRCWLRCTRPCTHHGLEPIDALRAQ